MESQPQNPEFRINPENFHPCNLPTQLSTHGQWWSNFATHLLHTEQCLDLRGRRMRQVVQNWCKLKFWDSASSRIH